MTEVKSKVRTIYHLIKPEDHADSIISILVIAIIANGSLSLSSPDRLLSALLFGFFFLTGTIILNQYFDIEVDRINKPYRPLPSGSITPKKALCLTFFCYLVAFIISAYLGIVYTGIGVAGILLSLLYSHPYTNIRRRSIVIQVFIINAGYSIITFLIGWCVYKPLSFVPLWFMAFLFLTDVGGVFSKDYMDYKGDKKHGYVTLPTLFGYKKAAELNAVLYVVPFATVFLMSITRMINQRFILLASYCIITGLYAFSLIIKKEDIRNATFCYYIITANFIAVRILSVWALVT
jgi:geranylgeranylglycerol-phosphate geranylgeranyltransferase